MTAPSERHQPDRTDNPRVPRSALHRSSFTTRAQADFRSGGWKRMLAAAGVAVLALIALLVFGPSQEEVKERFEYYGAPGEMRIMKEISIDDGRDHAAQLPRSLQVPQPSQVEVIDETPDPRDAEPVPEPKVVPVDKPQPIVEDYQPDAEVSDRYQVEMSLPMQTSQAYYLRHMVRPEYPLNASETERRTPVIQVAVEMFIGPEGDVTALVVRTNNQNLAFEEAARQALEQWKFDWLIAPGAGRWVTFTINFKSPYFNLDR